MVDEGFWGAGWGGADQRRAPAGGGGEKKAARLGAAFVGVQFDQRRSSCAQLKQGVWE